MDVQSHLTYDPAKIGMLDFAAPLLPSAEYSTKITNFPGMNCFPPYATSGNFFLSVEVYEQGKKLGELHSKCVNETGCLEIELDELTRLYSRNVEGLVISHFHHAQNVPPELYLSSFHRRTGTYVAFPASAYMGDTIYPGHASSLENAQFWPGGLAQEHAEEYVLVLNPYRVSFLYQISLYIDGKPRQQTKVAKIQPFSSRTLSVRELFPETYGEIAESKGKCAICVAAQYKVIALIMFKNTDIDVITTIDHLHSYQLY